MGVSLHICFGKHILDIMQNINAFYVGPTQLVSVSINSWVVKLFIYNWKRYSHSYLNTYFTKGMFTYTAAGSGFSTGDEVCV